MPLPDHETRIGGRSREHRIPQRRLRQKSRVQITVADQIAAIKLLLLYGYGMPKARLIAVT
jgi:hypothetical protein